MNRQQSRRTRDSVEQIMYLTFVFRCVADVRLDSIRHATISK